MKKELLKNCDTFKDKRLLKYNYYDCNRSKECFEIENNTILLTFEDNVKILLSLFPIKTKNTIDEIDNDFFVSGDVFLQFLIEDRNIGMVSDKYLKKYLIIGVYGKNKSVLKIYWHYYQNMDIKNNDVSIAIYSIE